MSQSTLFNGSRNAWSICAGMILLFLSGCSVTEIKRGDFHYLSKRPPWTDVSIGDLELEQTFDRQGGTTAKAKLKGLDHDNSDAWLQALGSVAALGAKAAAAQASPASGLDVETLRLLKEFLVPAPAPVPAE